MWPRDCRHWWRSENRTARPDLQVLLPFVMNKSCMWIIVCGLVGCSRITWPAGKECVQCQACAKPNAACPQQMISKRRVKLAIIGRFFLAFLR